MGSHKLLELVKLLFVTNNTVCVKVFLVGRGIFKTKGSESYQKVSFPLKLLVFFRQIIEFYVKNHDLVNENCQVGRGGVDRASSSDA